MLAALLILLAVAAAIVALGFYAAYRHVLGDGREPLTVRPEKYGLAYEPVSCRTSDGLNLKGWFIPASTPSSRTLLFCHGYGTNKGQILEFTHALAGLGFNLLYFDFRACGESEGNRVSVGYLERRDFDAVAAFLKSYRPDDRCGVFGLSMGAMVSFCGLNRHPFFAAAALEAPFKSHDSAVARYMRVAYSVPYYPLIPVMLFWLRVLHGGDPEPLSPEAASPEVARPVLAIFGEDDRMAPAEQFTGTLAKVKAPTEVWRVPGAGHAKCGEIAGREYAERLARFFSAHMPETTRPRSPGASCPPVTLP